MARIEFIIAKLGRLAISAHLVAAIFSLGGCNIVGPAAYIVSGPPKLPAKHTLADVPTVVFIDDRSNVVSPVSLRRVIAEKAGQTLMVKKQLTTTISPQDAMSLATQRERNSNILPVEEIGKIVGAKQVIYVEMVNFTSSPDGFTPRPTALCKVRVIDVENRTRAFPPAESAETAYMVQAMTQEVDPELYRTRSGRLKIYEALAQQTGQAVAELFYEHERKELGSGLSPS